MTQLYPRRRPRAIAGSERSRGFGPDFWLAALMTVGALLLSAGAWGQDNPPAPPGTIPPRGSQTAEPKSPGAAEPSSPGTGITNSTGVIRPPGQVDPGINAKPPVSSSALPTPVIPPPGTAGGNNSVQPK